jgi:hypothetical protein
MIPGYWTDDQGFCGGPRWRAFPTLTQNDVISQCSGCGIPPFKAWKNDLFINRPQRVYPNLEACPMCFDGPLLI